MTNLVYQRIQDLETRTKRLKNNQAPTVPIYDVFRPLSSISVSCDVFFQTFLDSSDPVTSTPIVSIGQVVGGSFAPIAGLTLSRIPLGWLDSAAGDGSSTLNSHKEPNTWHHFTSAIDSASPVDTVDGSTIPVTLGGSGNYDGTNNDFKVFFGISSLNTWSVWIANISITCGSSTFIFNPGPATDFSAFDGQIIISGSILLDNAPIAPPTPPVSGYDSIRFNLTPGFGEAFLQKFMTFT